MDREPEPDVAQGSAGLDLQIGEVDPGEMAFAMALFFAAARGQVPTPSTQSASYELRREPGIESPALASVRKNLIDMKDAASDEVPLACAVAVVWQHYEGAEDRHTICSRLVAFYSLMVRSHGAVIDGNTQPTKGDPSSVVLDPSVIQAVATAPLSSEGQFDDLRFRSLVLDSAEGERTAAARALFTDTARAGTPIRVTNTVQELVKLLFACEATIAPREPSHFYEFRVLNRLCEPFAAVSGAQNLQPLLTRALASSRSNFAWLGSARVTPAGRIEEIDMLKLNLNPHEALQGELALMGSLVELLRSLLGDGVTIQLLRRVWPLASITQAPSNS